jgi:hypothetical protein
LPAAVFFRASVFKVLTSAGVQERRFPFFMSYLPAVKKRRLLQETAACQPLPHPNKTAIEQFQWSDRIELTGSVITV